MENSKIEWTDHTKSPWHGCSHKILSDGTEHPGCKNCYAEAMSGRNPATLGTWGEDGTRVGSKSFIRSLETWNRQGQKEGRVYSVFPSICDPFEDRPELVPLREEMFAAIDRLPWVRLLLLTKRPENVRRMWTGVEVQSQQQADDLNERGELFRRNVWIGTSVSDQKTAIELIPHLLQCRDLTPVLFLSAEPLLGSIFLSSEAMKTLDWVIVGGESGHGARPMHPQWARDLLSQCLQDEVPYLFKQWGEWAPGNEHAGADLIERDRTKIQSGFFSYSDHWYQGGPNPFRQTMDRVGKTAAGRTLDGQVWDQFPNTETANA